MADNLVPLVASKVSVNLDDVVSVRVAEVELQLDNLLQAQKEKVVKARERADVLKKDLHPAIEADGKADFKTRFATVNAELKKTGCKAQVYFNSCSLGGELKPGKLFYSVWVGEKEIAGTRNSGYVFASVEISAIKSKDVMDDLESAEIVFKAENAKLLKLYEAKNRVPQVERTARATVATQRLEQTEEGRDILSRLRKDDVNKLLMLPAGTL